MQTQILLLCICGAVFLFLAVIPKLGGIYSLRRIKNKRVGDGQHGTARFATRSEVMNTYKRLPYAPTAWRNAESFPTTQGLIVGCETRLGQTTALVDDGDIHTLMIGASGVGKTACFEESEK